MERAAAPLPLDDIQGIILRKYELPLVRHFVLEIGHARAAQRVVAGLAGDRSALAVTSAVPVAGPRESAVNIGFTYSGLAALYGGEQRLGGAFEDFGSFRQGAARRARYVGDRGASAPRHWIGGLGTPRAHAVVSLYSASKASHVRLTGELLELLREGGAFRELHHFDGEALPGGRVHFGYRDGISQPRVEGDVDGGGSADPQPPVPAWHFVLDRNPAARYRMGASDLLLHGSFAAFRVMRQDVFAFERYLRRTADGLDMDPELLAAKLCGRWRTGAPLELSPDSPAGVPESEWNNFDYAASDPRSDGARTPLGCHIRRANPRGMHVVGGAIRIIRRAVPYGREWVAGMPEDGEERGLLGLFICADLKRQFEYVMRQWIHEGGFMTFGNLPPSSRDPLIGSQPRGGGRLLISGRHERPVSAGGLSPFVTTRAAAYLFLPGLNALRALAAISPTTTTTAVRNPLNAERMTT